jgi:hypothetical protein
VPEGVTSDPTRTDLVFDWRADLATDWRATALFGHPLENAMLMGAFLICMASRGTAWLGTRLRLGLGILASWQCSHSAAALPWSSPDFSSLS